MPFDAVAYALAKVAMKRALGALTIEELNAHKSAVPIEHPDASVTDAKISSVDWAKVANKPSTYPPSPHTHGRGDVTDLFTSPFWANIPDKPFSSVSSEFTVSSGNLQIAGIDASKITSGRLSLSRLPTSSTANRFLVVRTANADPTFDVLTAGDIPNLDASKITSGRFSLSRLPTSSTANRFLVVRTANADPTYDALTADDIPTISRSKIGDFFTSPFWTNIPDKPSTFPSALSQVTIDVDKDWGGKNISGLGSLTPSTDNSKNLGSSTLRWANVYAVNVISADLCFEEKVCEVCGEQFREGEELVLKVKKVDDITRTIPIHLKCSDAYKQLDERLRKLEGGD